MRRNLSPFFERCILGTAGLGGVWGKVDKEESITAILTALEHGITAIDTAPAYGDAESLVGQALQRWEGPAPQINTKVGRLKSYAADQCFCDFSSDGMERSVDESLRTLGVPVIDLLFLHEPSAITMQESDRVIEKMVDFKKKGYAKKIGVGGNSPEWFKKYISPDIFDVVMEFNRLNACCLDALDTSLAYCEVNGIDFYVASPLHMGLLGSRFEPFTEAPPAWLDKKNIEHAKQVKRIADTHGMPLSSLAHRFLLTIPHQFKIVIGAMNLHQLRLTIADFNDGSLSADMYAEIISLF